MSRNELEALQKLQQIQKEQEEFLKMARDMNFSSRCIEREKEEFAARRNQVLDELEQTIGASVTRFRAKVAAMPERTSLPLPTIPVRS